jgi:superfamily I DNA and RNA helicase
MASTARLPLIACSLDAAGQQDRLAQWRNALAAAVAREETSQGVRYAFDADAERRIRDLAAAEQGCCSFLKFDITRQADQVLMNVTAPADQLDALRLIFPSV